MKTSEKEKIKFTVTDKLKARASELLDESQAMQFAEGLRLNNAAAVVFDREQMRLEMKYGKDDQRAKDMVLRAEATATAKADLFSRYIDAITPPTKPKEGWAVDGFVRGPDGRGLEGLTVAAYDKQENRFKEFGQATTDERGYFSITVEKLPEKPPKQVLMRAAKRRTLLPSNDVSVSPEPGGVERIEIIVRVKERVPEPVDDKLPDKPTEQPTDKPTDKSVVGPKDKPAEPAKGPTLTVKPVVAKKSTTAKRKSSTASKTKAKPATKRSGRAGTKKRSK